MKTLAIPTPDRIDHILLLYRHFTLGRRDIQALMVSCPNAECDEVMERQNLPQHVHMTCPCILNSCKYKSIGCDTELNKKDMSAHEEDDKLHLHMALDTVAALRAECLMFKRSGSVTFTIRDFQKMKMASESFTGPPFYTHAYGYLIALRLKANGHGSKVGTHVAVGICLLSGKYDSVLKWPFVGSVSFTLMNQLQDDDHYSHTLVIDDKRAGDAVGTNLIPHTELSLDPFGTTQYLKDDTMYIRVSVEVNGRKPWLED